MFTRFSQICGMSKQPVILMIDEVDSASNNQVFIDFLEVYHIMDIRVALAFCIEILHPVPPFLHCH